MLISPDEYESWRESFAVRAQSGLMKEIKAVLAAPFLNVCRDHIQVITPEG